MAAPNIELVRTEADVTDHLRWNTPSVVTLLRGKGIRTRGELARRMGVTRRLVNYAFDEDWRGRATAQLIARLALFFEVPIGQLVIEPAATPTRPRIFEFETPANQNGRRPVDEILLVTCEEAARRLSLSMTEIEEARRCGDLVARRYSSKVLIPVTELRRFAESLPVDEP